jgi:protease II
VHGAEASASTLRYAMLLNSVNDVCADLSRDANKSKQFIEEVHKLHKRLMEEDKGEQQTDDNTVTLKDPPIIRKGSAQLKNPMKEGLLPEVSNVNIWLNGDGSVSEPVEQISSEMKSAKKRKQLKEGSIWFERSSSVYFNISQQRKPTEASIRKELQEEKEITTSDIVHSVRIFHISALPCS